jgi:hypothetical protein
MFTSVAAEEDEGEGAAAVLRQTQRMSRSAGASTLTSATCGEGGTSWGRKG